MAIGFLLSIFGITASSIITIIEQHGYLAIFLMLVIEAASFPLPSELVLPAVGYLVATGRISLLPAFAAVILGGIVGMAIDYFIAYFLGKDVVYKHLHLFHIKKERLLAFDSWFDENGPFAVFVARLLPIVRGLINFPAGFAKMNILKFYAYSLPGNIIWAILLIGFGYYALPTNNFYLLAFSLFLFALAMYIIYIKAMKSIRKSSKS